MRTALRFLLLLVAWRVFSPTDAWAQACGTATTTVVYGNRTAGEDWKNHAQVGIPDAAGATKVSTSGYTPTSTTASTLAIGTLNGATMVWTNDFSAATGNTTVTFTFSRPLSNFTVNVQDIDASRSGGLFDNDPNYTDQVAFAGANGGTAVVPTLTSTAGTNLVIITPGTATIPAYATGVDDNNANTSALVTATFPSPINTLTLTYRNGSGLVNPDAQAVGIDQMTWCRVVPVANNVTNSTTLPTNAGQVNIDNLSSTVDGTVGSYTITAIPPAAQGVLYYNSTGSTYVAVTNGRTLTPAQAASLRFDPAAGATGSSTTFSYTVTDDANLTSAAAATYTIPLNGQAACAATAALDFSNTTARPAGEDWKNHAAISVPAGSPLTTVGTNGYSATGNPNPATLQIAMLNGVQSLVWSNDYPAAGANDKSTITFNFNRAVSNFTVQVQDIDAATNGFQDQVIFTGSNAGTAVTPVLSPVNPNTAYFTISGNTATGVLATGGNSSATDASVVAYFGAPITSLTITYNNTSTANDPGVQFIGIDLLSFCRLAPVANPVASTVSDAATKAAVGALTSQVDGTVASYSFTSVPTAAQGTLFLGNTAVTTGTVITPAQASQLTFTPAAGFTGPLSLNYTVKDDAGQVSPPATYAITVNASGASGTPAACANPGRDGSPTGLTTNPNTYYPSTASQTLAVGATSIAVGAATGTTNIAAGDLLLVIQMQGADIDATNTDAYGDGVVGGGANGNRNTNFTAGTYEYVVANSAVTATAGGTITLATALKNGYVNAVATATAGQRSFQVIRVPQFGNLTLGGNIAPIRWNGSVGGIIAIDVAKQTNLNGFTIDASGAGFRGGAGRQLAGNAAATGADYRFLSGTAGSTSGAHGSKGEGTAGTPAFVNSGATAGFTNGTGALLATGTDYPNGSNGRGAPGNAGGGGTDNLSNTNNSENSGGAGGANGGAGGRGGNTWNTNLAIGGEPGAAFAVASSSRLVLGGGGGAGSTNDATGTPNAGFASSGAAGGGLVMLRTGTVSGTGSILANGVNANNSVANDGSGGGGAGGSILVTATTPAGLTNLTLTANGGTGGTNTGGGVPHGPGGGGGGGVILTNGSTAAASAATGAAAGTTNGGTSFGAAPGLTGDTNAQISNSVANSVSGASCPADVTTTITGPTTLSVGQPAGSASSYTATFTNNGTGAAANVTQTVTLPAGATVTAANLPTGATFTTTGTGATAVTTVNFGTAATLANGASNTFAFSFTAPATAGSYPLTTNVAADSNEGTNTAPDAATLTIQVNNPPANCAKSYYDNTNSYSGLSADYYPGNYNGDPAFFNNTTPTDKGIASTVNYSRAAANMVGTFPLTSATVNAGNNVFSARYRGNITITTAGSYTIYVSADDRAQAWIDGAAVGTPVGGQAIINTDFNTRPGTKTLNLSAGQHNILIYYNANGQPDDITLLYSGPDTNGSTVVIPNSVLCAGLGNIPPVAVNKTNVNIPSSAGPTTLNPSLAGTDQDGTVTNYAVATLPTAAQGVLRLNGTAVTAGQVITAAQAAMLTFQPTAGFTGTATFTFSAIDNSGQYSNDVATYTIPVVPSISGYVYEDANYGGGVGRSRATLGTSAVGRPGARVELYDNQGNFVTSTLTDANGFYALPASATTAYTVRVVNNTVISARPGASFTGTAATGYTSDQLAVQTYNGTTDRVGGEAPQKVDAAAGTTGTTLASLNTATTIAESQFTVNTNSAATTGADFGYNFDVVTNTNDAGQGSLRQFITNSNALGGETSLAQSGSNGAGTLVAGRETSIFMIPTGSAVAGQRAGLVSGLTNGVAVITPATALPAISGPNTAIDGTTQTFNEGNTNNVLLGAGGTVGTGATPLSQVNGPEVQLVGSTAISSGLNVAAAGTGTNIIGLAVYGFGNTLNGNSGDNDLTGNIISAADNFSLSKSVVGSTANSFTNPSIPNTAGNVRILSGTGVVVTNNLVGFSGLSGIRVASTGATVTNNEIRSSAQMNTTYDGLQVRGSSLMATGNLFIANSGQGVDIVGSTGSNSLTGNTFTGNGIGNATSAPTETAAIRINNGTGNTVSQNIINANYGAGVQVSNGATGVISQNSIYSNGTITSANGTAASGQIGIDLLSSTDNAGLGTGPYVTINDNGDGDTGGNGLLNFPVITSSAIVGTNLVVTGYARPGSVIELFGTGTPDPTGFGEGRTYLGTFTEGSAADTNTGTGTYGPGNVNGLNQGTDNTNLFTFTIPLTGNFAGLTAGTVLTSTATLGGGTSEFSGNVQVLGADVTTTITGPNTLAAGQPSGTFTVAFSNVGTGAAAAVAQTVALPANATLTTAQQNAITAAYPGTTFSTTGNVTTITFPQAATLAAGATNVYQFAFTAPTASGSTSIVSNVSATNEGSNIAPNMASFALTVTDVADVAATIVGTGAPVAAGATGTFTATFTNNGPASAINTQPKVQLVPGLANVTLDGNGPTSTTGGIATYANGSTYNSNTGLLTGPSFTLTSGQSVSSTIGYTQPAQGNVTATAAVTTTTSQAGQTANDSQSATNVGGPGFDLATTLAGPSSAVAGTQVTYAVTTLNNGPGTAPSALQTVSIPTTAALTNVFLTNGGTYSFSNGTSVFTFPAIPALGSGQQTNNSISFTSPASGASSLVVTSLVTPNTPTAGDASTANNQASITTNLTTAPAAAGNTANLNVAIASNAPTSGVAAGSTVVFTVTQGNNGPNAATNVATQVYLPAGLTGVVVKDKNGNVLTNSTTSGYNAATGVVILPTETTEASANTPLTYTISATAPAMGVITATASVSASTNDPVAADNVAITQVTVNTPLVSDVATSLSGPAVAAPGESITYTVTSTNNSATPATGVTQTVQLPAGLSGVVVKDANGNVVANSATTGYNAATGLVTFATQATLGAGSSVMRTITLPAPSNAGSATGGSIVPVASVTSTSNDNVQANNSASMTTTIVPVSDFVVSLSGPASIVAGNPVTYTVATTNNGPSVGGQQTSVQLPAGLSGVLVGGSGPTSTSGATSTYANGATYNSTTGVLTLPALAAQGLGTANAQSNVITFLAPTNVVELTPTAQVTPASGTNDATLSNNAATATTTVTPATMTVIDLATTVTSNAPANTQTAGQPITFTVTSTNNTTGSSATGVVQQLSLAVGLSGVLVDGGSPTATTNGISTYANGATYNANTGVVTFASATVANGTPATHTVQVAAPGSGPLVATAAVKGDQSDNTPANNTNSTSVTITPSADLVTSTTGPTATQPGTPVSYSVVTTNNGPSAAANVVPTITLPAGATNVVLPPGATLSGNVVTFATVGSLANGQAATNTVTFTSPATAGSYTVSSSSSSTAVGATPATADPSTGNNASSLATTSTAPTAVPVAFNVVNQTAYNATNGTYGSPSGNTAGSNLISPLSAAASMGQSVAKYTITTIPTAAQGTLYYNAGTAGAPNYQAVGINQDLTPAQAASLRFDPADNATTTASVGDISFAYTATDNLGKVSNTALYTIPVSQDNQSLYTTTPVKGGAVVYQNNDVIAYVVDPNGAAYDSNGLIYQTTGANAGKPVNAMSPVKNGVAAATTTGVFTSSSTTGVTSLTDLGLTYDTTTGAISVLDRTKLKAGTYTLNMTTTDLFGGITTQPVTFTIGALPLPVSLVAFTAEAVQNRDALLKWTTASELNNDHFDVERSLDGTTYAKIGQVQGQGSKSSPTAYTLTDAAVAAKASGQVYYRLKQVDTNGATSYSPVRTVSFTNVTTPAIALYPNPATTTTQLDLTQLPTGTYQVSLLDATGRVVLRAEHEAGLSHSLDLTMLATGTYTVLVRGQHDAEIINLTKRLIKE